MLTHMGCYVKATDSGETALKALAEGGSNIDAAIIDFAMPGMNGIEVADRLLARCPNLPVVIVTGYADGRAAEIAQYRLLKKPFHRDDLAGALIAELRLPVGHGGNIVPLRSAGARLGSDGRTAV
jgi:CheY-like chemotaxis protein